MRENYAIRLDEKVYKKIKEKHNNFSLYIRSLIDKDLNSNSDNDCCEKYLKLKEELAALSKKYK